MAQGPDPGSDALLRAVGGASSQIRLLSRGGDRWAIQSVSNNLLWQAETSYAGDGEAEIRAVASTTDLSADAQFRLYRFASGEVAIQCVANGHYLVVELPDGTRFQGAYYHLVRASSDSVVSTGRFRLS